MSFIPQRISVGATPAIGASITGGGSVSGRVAYFDSNTTITGDSTFTFDGTTVQARGFLARYDNNGVTRIQVRNDNAGASAFAQFKLSTDAGDFNINANSTAAGDSVQLTTDSTFGGGMDIGILGNNTLRLNTNGSTAISIAGNQNISCSGTVTVTTSSGPQFTAIDGGSIGVNADPHYQMNDTNGSVGRIGFTDSASKDFKIQNQTDTGLLDFVTTATQIAGSAGAATGTYWTIKLGGTTYKLALLNT